MNVRFGSVCIVGLVVLAGCQSAAQHRAAVQNDTTDRVTVGIVQREIKAGMSGAEVAATLGAPNIVTTDDGRREVWIYDKIATEAAYSKSDNGLSSLIVGVGDSIGGLVGLSGNRSAGASVSTQRSLTVVVRFDADGRVRDFAYHASQF